MKVSDIYQRYYDFSAKASESVRTLSLAGLATVWLFGGGSQIDVHHIQVSPSLLVAGALFVTTLTVDFLHAAVGSLVFRGYARHLEPTVTKDQDLTVPNWLPRIPLGFYLAKIALLIAGYAVLLSVLWSSL